MVGQSHAFFEYTSPANPTGNPWNYFLTAESGGGSCSSVDLYTKFWFALFCCLARLFCARSFCLAEGDGLFSVVARMDGRAMLVLSLGWELSLVTPSPWQRRCGTPPAYPLPGYQFGDFDDSDTSEPVDVEYYHTGKRSPLWYFGGKGVRVCVILYLFRLLEMRSLFF